MTRIDHHRPSYSDKLGQFKQSYHLEMAADRVRTAPIFQALREVLTPETSFCELGCGTGIFSIFAAAHARHVWAVELDPVMARIAAANIEASQFADRIELIVADAGEIELAERADVIFCEMMSIWAIEEPQIPVFNGARERLLRPGGLFLPQEIVNLVEIGRYNFRFGDVEMKAAIPLFSGISAPAIVTESRVAKRLVFSEPVSPDLGCEVELTALVGGRVNCARLTSIVQMGPGVVFSGSDTLMPPTIVPLAEELAVNSGDRLRFRAAARARSDLGEAVFEAEALAD
jgi:predicted RNA methylase